MTAACNSAELHADMLVLRCRGPRFGPIVFERSIRESPANTNALRKTNSSLCNEYQNHGYQTVAEMAGELKQWLDERTDYRIRATCDTDASNTLVLMYVK